MMNEQAWPVWQLYAMGVVAIASVIPMPLHHRWKSWQLYLPIASALLWIHYEHTIMVRIPGPIIHLDWAIVIPMFCIPLIASFIRIGIIRKQARDQEFTDMQTHLREAVHKGKTGRDPTST